MSWPKSFGISTVDMAAKATAMGVSYNDTMALMEAFGREKINLIIGQINCGRRRKRRKAAIDSVLAADRMRRRP